MNSKEESKICNIVEMVIRMTEGSDEFIQLEAPLSQFCLYGSKK